MIFKSAAALARFAPERMGKYDLFRTSHLFAGLNAFEPGQRHEPHAHCDRDKLYVVLSGHGEVQVGDRVEHVGPGDVAVAPADVVHSVFNPGPDRLVLLAVLSPPPAV